MALKAAGYAAEPATHGVDEREARELIHWHIHHLRNKLEPDPRQPRYIINVRGVGYVYNNL